MSDQHSAMWKSARMEQTHSSEALAKNNCPSRSPAPAAVLLLDRKFAGRAALALACAVAAESLVLEAGRALHLGAAIICIALAVAVTSSVCPLGRRSV